MRLTNGSGAVNYSYKFPTRFSSHARTKNLCALPVTYTTLLALAWVQLNVIRFYLEST